MSGKEAIRTGTKSFIACALMILFPIISSIVTSGEDLPGDAVLMGRIVDEGGQPVEDGAIFAIDSSGKLLNHTTSNSTGNFTFLLEDIPLPMDAVLIIQKDDFFRRSIEVDVGEGNNSVGDIRIIRYPSGSETISGTVNYPDGSPVDGADIRIEYQGIEGSYEDNMTTGAGGVFSFSLFPGDFRLFVEMDGITLFEMDVDVVSGEGPFEFEIEVPAVPERDITLQGYVTDGADPLSGAVVGIMDPEMEIGDYVSTNDSGYYSIPFWEGDHSIICMLDGTDGYQSMIELRTGDDQWHNITLLEEKYWINGSVKNSDGESLENITVQYFKPNTFLHLNSMKTESGGAFSIKVAEGFGYLAAMEENPFETEEYEVYLSQEMEVVNDLSREITLYEKEPTEGVMHANMEEWTSFSTWSYATLSLNTSMAARAFIDSMLGDGDLSVSTEEGDRFLDMMREDEGEMSEGPFGNSTIDDLTINGNHFNMLADSLVVEFLNLSGSISTESNLQMYMESAYEMNGTLESPLTSVEAVVNGSYQEEDEYNRMFLDHPSGWRYMGSSDTIHGITYERGKVKLIPAYDPDPADGADHEYITLTFANDTFSVEIEPEPKIYEGDEATLNLSVVDHIPGNDPTFTWEAEGVIINTTDPWLNHTFPENGTYDITISMTDDQQRETMGYLQVEVLNKDPLLELVMIDGDNRTFFEGDRLMFSVNGSDVPDDPLSYRWGLQGEWSRNMTLDEANSTFEIVIPDDGNITVQAMLFDDDGGVAFREIRLTARNSPPDVSIEIRGHSGPGKVIQGRWLTIIPNATDMGDDSISYSWNWPDEDGIEADENGSAIALRFLDPGMYNISLGVSDEDGGLRQLNWTIEVTEDFEFDNDGDGMPRWWETLHGLDDDDPSDSDDDPDMDDLTNLEEFLNGTDPGSIDTDSDGIPDRFEIENGLNPKIDDASEDPDGDGKNNLMEFKDGTDPMFKETEEESGDGTWILIMVIAIAVLVIMGTLILMISRKREMSLYDEE